MIRSCIVFMLFAGSALAQSRVDLLQRVAQHYESANSFEVKGTASALVPGSSWKVSYSFDAQGMQPTFLPLDARTSSLKDLESVGNFTRIRIDPHASDPLPDKPFSMEPFGTYHRLTQRILDATKVGSETIIIEGHAHTCEIIDASFDDSPQFRPHSSTAHRRFWVDPAELVVLREQRHSSGLDWTADVTFFSFDHPVSAETVEALRNFAKQPKDRPDWVGRALPDLTFQQLSGPPIKLADLQGKPVLLDFWGSYCPPCKVATLHAQELAKIYQTSGLTVITFTQDNADDARLWAAYNHVTLPIVLDKDETAFKVFDVNGVPVTIFADENGKIVHYWTGLDDVTEMDAVLSTTLKAHGAPTETSSPEH
jgi:peroxiredoxin